MKKIVRLKEGDLHNIIKESVNNIIQELDWRTYANAANKSAERQKDYKEKSKEKTWYDSILPSMARKRQRKISNLADKEYDRSERFASAANDAVKDQLGYKSKNGFEYSPELHLGASNGGKRLYPSSYASKGKDSIRDNGYKNQHYVTDIDGDFEEKLNSHDGYDEALDRYKRENGVVGSDFAKRMLDIEKQRMPTPYEKGRMNKGNRELGDWYNGKTKYKNGRYETEE